jgi:hypothetical protein
VLITTPDRKTEKGLGREKEKGRRKRDKKGGYLDL